MSYWIDYWLNRVSMYRLLSICLSMMWAMSLLLSILGIIDFAPLALIVGGLVIVGTTYLSSRLFGWLFGIRPHGESSYISALILFFIFTPTLELRGIMALGLIGMIASLSKYILTISGRHVFNPAAIAAVVIGLTGLAFASWWVATPSLLPITLLSTLLILYKTRRFALGLSFLAVSLPLVLIMLISNGVPIAEAVTLLMSWPFLFFVGFMLSEPLTLPPKKWQQIIEACIVGVLFAVPIHIGSFATTIAISLIIGNIVAYIFSKRRVLELTLTNRHKLTPTTEEFVFSLDKNLSFEAGQYMEIAIPHKHKDGRGLRRSFSIASPPNESSVKFGVKFYDPSSSFKKELNNLSLDTIIFATTIGGDFTLPKNSNSPLLFIAGGIGITPFISHLLYLKQQKQSRDIILVYAVSNIDEVAYIDTLKNAAIKVIIVTKSDKAPSLTDWTLINESYLTKEILKDAVPDIALRTAYVSGPPQLVNITKKNLRKLGVKKVKSDYFTGY